MDSKETERNGEKPSFPIEWEVRTLKELVSINEMSLDKKTECRVIEYIDIDSVEKGIIRRTQSLSLELAPSRARRIVRDGDVLISSVRPNLRHYCRIRKPNRCTIASTGFIVLTPKKVDSDFLYYSIATEAFTNYLSAVAETSTTVYPSITANVVGDSKILSPQLEEQKTIAKILSDLDSKIELNREMNKTHESIAQAIFKHWFIDFEFPNEEGKPYKSSGGEMVDSELGKIPEGWRVCKLANYVNVIKGCSYRIEDLKESNIALVTLKSFNRGGGFNQDGYKEYVGDYERDQILNEGDIIIAQTDLTQKAEVIGRAAIVNSLGKYSRLIASLDLQIVRPKESLPLNYIYYLLNRDAFHNHALSYANGTTVLHLNKNAVLEYMIVIPPKDILERFDLCTTASIKKIGANIRENDGLENIRDLLLPKLMTGKIKVPLES